MSDINYVEFMYLNPELTADPNINILTIEQAKSYLDSGNGANLYHSLSNVPDNFDAEAFIIANRDTIDTSELSLYIRDAMSNLQIREREIQSKSKYLATIFRNCIYMGYDANDGYDQFEITESNFVLSPSNLGYLDEVLLLDEENNRFFSQIQLVTPSTFTLGANDYIFYPGSNYRIYGIKLTDVDRIGKINYVRNFDRFQSSNAIASVSQDFNPNLYRTLYMDAVQLDDTACYLDYLAKAGDGEFRIQNAEQMLTNTPAYGNITNLRVLSNIEIIGLSRIFEEAIFYDTTTTKGSAVMAGVVTTCNTVNMIGNVYAQSNVTVGKDFTV